MRSRKAEMFQLYNLYQLGEFSLANKRSNSIFLKYYELPNKSVPLQNSWRVDPELVHMIFYKTQEIEVLRFSNFDPKPAHTIDAKEILNIAENTLNAD